MKKITFILLLCTFIKLSSYAQITNASFEHWNCISDSSSSVASLCALNGWLHYFQNGTPNDGNSFFGTYKDSLAQEGKYALMLSRWYNVAFDVVKFVGACTTKPTNCTGYYNYQKTDLNKGKQDTAVISLHFFKYDTNTKQRDTIGFGKKWLTNQADYTFFNCAITYTQPNLMPDSMIVDIRPSKFTYGHGCASSATYCSYLRIDDLKLTEFNATKESENQLTFLIFPNPSEKNITLRSNNIGEQIRICNVVGQTVFQTKISEKEMTINVEHLAHGLYFVFINDKRKSFFKQ